MTCSKVCRDILSTYEPKNFGLAAKPLMMIEQWLLPGQFRQEVLYDSCDLKSLGQCTYPGCDKLRKSIFIPLDE